MAEREGVKVQLTMYHKHDFLITGAPGGVRAHFMKDGHEWTVTRLDEDAPDEVLGEEKYRSLGDGLAAVLGVDG